MTIHVQPKIFHHFRTSESNPKYFARHHWQNKQLIHVLGWDIYCINLKIVSIKMKPTITQIIDQTIKRVNNIGELPILISTESEHSSLIITFWVLVHKTLPNNRQTVLESPNFESHNFCSSKSCYDMESNALEKSSRTDTRNPDLSTPRWISLILLDKSSSSTTEFTKLRLIGRKQEARFHIFLLLWKQTSQFYKYLYFPSIWKNRFDNLMK
jgi:hypothetical protein